MRLFERAIAEHERAMRARGRGDESKRSFLGHREADQVASRYQRSGGLASAASWQMEQIQTRQSLM
jgi:hypothetical protein